MSLGLSAWCKACGLHKYCYHDKKGLYVRCKSCHNLVANSVEELNGAKSMSALLDSVLTDQQIKDVTIADQKDSALDNQVGGSHYKDLAIQPVEYIHANKIPFIEGNIIKYITRWKTKNGVEDLKKVKHYVELLIELEERSKIKTS